MVGLSPHIRNHYHLPPQCFHVAITYSPSWPRVPVSSQSHRHTRQLEIQNDFEYQCFPYSKCFVQTGVLLSRTACLRNKQILYKLHCTSRLNKAEQKLAVDPPTYHHLSPQNHVRRILTNEYQVLNLANVSIWCFCMWQKTCIEQNK